jgi:site-specific DNA-methyltransferase (adenine-specific)
LDDYSEGTIRILSGDSLKRLYELEDASVEALITDPPAGIEFMGKDWDTFKRGRYVTHSGPPALAPGKVGDDTSPRGRHRVHLDQRANRKCQVCGGYQWSGASKCRCASPTWERDTSTRDTFIAFMAAVATECLRVLKPGAHGLIWAIPRTSHWTATALEDAGFEVRDIVHHHFGSGFPKSLDVSKAIDRAAGAEREVVRPPPYSRGRATQSYSDTRRVSYDYEVQSVTAPATDAARQWEGWGTALKPATEHWILVRKPLSEATVAGNVLEYGTGALNVDGCRVAGTPPSVPQPDFAKVNGRSTHLDAHARNGQRSRASGRWPANLVLSHSDRCVEGCPVAELNWQSGSNVSRFFYMAKASTNERNAGLSSDKRNTHPTVKPIALMRYLCRMITPPNGTVLDPFMGSGTTGCAAVLEGFRFIGIEQDEGSVETAVARLQYWQSQPSLELA